MARYFANVARDRPRVGPDDLPGAIGILADAAKPGEIVGIAFGVGHLGSQPEDLGPREATWRLVLGKVELEGRFVLRLGEFVELAEDVV